jgi:hypothetical protein
VGNRRPTVEPKGGDRILLRMTSKDPSRVAAHHLRFFRKVFLRSNACNCVGPKNYIERAINTSNSYTSSWNPNFHVNVALGIDELCQGSSDTTVLQVLPSIGREP